MDSGPSLNLALLWSGECGSLTDPAEDMSLPVARGSGLVPTKTGREIKHPQQANWVTGVYTHECVQP